MGTGANMLRAGAAVAGGSLAFSGLACAQQLDPAETPSSAPATASVFEPDENLLADPSFEERGGVGAEDGASEWWSFHERSPDSWGPFEITDERARSGDRSARLVVDSGQSDGAARVYGVVQEVRADRCPQYLSGWYRVEGWERTAPKQYLQAVVIVWDPARMPGGVRANNYQLALTLAGVDAPPLPNVVNRRFVVSGPVEPRQGEWVFFEIDLIAAFEREWGIRPDEFAYLRVFFEARYDERKPGESARATVYYDDLYLGDESRAAEAAEDE